MPRLAANLSLLYAQLPFLDRFEAAARDGFAAVECQFPYAWPAREIAARLQGTGLALVLLNAPQGGTTPESIAEAGARGDRGTAARPGREQEFRAGVRLALDYAAALGTGRIHVMSGVGARGDDAGRVRATWLANLQWAAEQAAATKAGCMVLIEPLNPHDMPGYLLQRQDDAHAIVGELALPNLKVQLDLYHCQRVEGDAAQRLARDLPTGRVGHLQIAGAPARDEPDAGVLDGAALMRRIDEIAATCDWDGFVGCEYRPRADTSAGLAWARPWLRAVVAS